LREGIADLRIKKRDFEENYHRSMAYLKIEKISRSAYRIEMQKINRGFTDWKRFCSIRFVNNEQINIFP
jgi:hypothetical protein